MAEIRLSDRMTTNQTTLTRREFLAAAIAAAAVVALPFEVAPTKAAHVPGPLTLKDLLEARETLRRMDVWGQYGYVLVHPNAGVTPEMGEEWYRLTGTRVVYATAGRA